MGFLSTRQRLFAPSRSRLAFLLVGVFAFVGTEAGRYVYRPYVRSHGLDDFGLADSVGNLGGIVVQVFLGAAALNCTARQSYRAAAFFAVGYILYEFVQPYLPKGVFDWKDVVATVVGYGVAVLVLKLVWRRLGGEGPARGRPRED